MNTPQQRRLISELAVGLLICGAAQFFFVAPAEHELDQLRHSAESRSNTDAAAPSASLSAEQLAVLDRRVDRIAAEVAERSQTASDETRLFTAIMDLADESGVRVDQLQPVEIPAARAAALPPPPPPPAPGDPAVAAVDLAPVVHDTSFGYSIMLSGSYAQVVRFVHRLPEDLGYTVIRSLRISPADDRSPNMVRAQVDTRHFVFDTSAFSQTGAAPQATSGVPE